MGEIVDYRLSSIIDYRLLYADNKRKICMHATSTCHRHCPRHLSPTLVPDIAPDIAPDIIAPDVQVEVAS